MTTTNSDAGFASQPPLDLPRRVFITGAGGFIGRSLMQRYRQLGCQVLGVDLVADQTNSIVKGDLAKPSEWANHADGCDLFINTAAVVSLSASWADYQAGSMTGVRNVLDVAVAAGAKRFIHLSSIAAMGWQYSPDADETSPVVIGNHYRYGVAKGASEHVVLAAHARGEIDCTIIRPGDVYGPGSRAWLLEPLAKAKQGQLILPDGGRHAFTPIYIDDLVDGIVLAASSAQAAGNIYILWGDEPVSCRDFFTHHWQWAGRKGHPLSLPLPLALMLTQAVWMVNQRLGRNDEASPDAMRMFARPGGYSIAKARQQLGFSPKVNLKEGMRRSEQWLRAQGHLPALSTSSGVGQ